MLFLKIADGHACIKNEAVTVHVAHRPRMAVALEQLARRGVMPRVWAVYLWLAAVQGVKGDSLPSGVANRSLLFSTLPQPSAATPMSSTCSASTCTSAQCGTVPYVCTAGPAVNGCSLSPWEISSSCSASCDLGTCGAVPPSPSPGPPSGSCVTMTGVQCVGNDIRNVGVTSTATACCQQCLSTSGCGAWTWNRDIDQHCWLKTSCSHGYDSNVDSGTITPSPPSPTPTPTPSAMRFAAFGDAIEIKNAPNALGAGVVPLSEHVNWACDVPSAGVMALCGDSHLLLWSPGDGSIREVPLGPLTTPVGVIYSANDQRVRSHAVHLLSSLHVEQPVI